MVRVLFVLNGLGVGGSERKTVAVANKLHDDGWPVHIAYLDPRTAIRDSIRDGIDVTFLKRRGKLDARSIHALRSLITSYSIQRMVCVNVFPLLYTAMAIQRLRKDARPDVFLFENRTEHLGLREIFYKIMYRFVLPQAQRIVFGSQLQRRTWIDRYSLEPTKCMVIYNGVDVERFRPMPCRKHLIAANGAKVQVEGALNIGAVGTLWPNKNHIELVHVLQKVRLADPTAQLLIAGEGSERERLISTAKELGVQKWLVMLGQLSDVRDMLRSVDIFVLPSISETFSNAALEAMAMGKAVILSNTGGLPEMVSHGRDGYLYDQGDIDQLAELVLLLATNESLRRAIASNARRTAVSKFSLERMARDYADLLG